MDVAKFEELHRKVADVLHADWDPIGVRDIAQADDEYDRYVNSVIKMILAKKSAAELSDYLLEVETDAMGLTGDRDRAWSVAEKLLELKDSFS